MIPKSENADDFFVLLVEDNLADANLFTSILRQKSPNVKLHVAHDGAEAVEWLQKTGSTPGARLPDVMLLDLNLPCKNGFEVLADTRAESCFRQLPVYLMTTSASKEDSERASALGVEAFLTKPVDLTGIEQMVTRLVEEEFPRILRRRHTSAEASAPATAATNPPQTNDQFRHLVESVKDYAIFMLSPSGYILSWNEGAQRIKQYRSHEIIGKHFSTFYTTEDIQRQHPENELKIAEAESRYEEEGWRIRKDGSKFWASVTISAIRSATGELLGFGKVTRDLTERKLAEEKLRASEERFRILIDGVEDYAICMLDPSGRVISWNRGAERVNGYKATEILGNHFSVFYTDAANLQHLPDHELEVARKTGRHEDEAMRVRKDGTSYWANVAITSLYTEDRELTGFALVTRDITERKRVEQEVLELNTELEHRVQQRTRELEESKAELEKQTEELVRSNSDLQQFAYVASHDLQEPLRIVISHLQFIEKRDKQNVSADSQASMTYAIENAMRMRNLVQDLLAYARIEKSSESMKAVDLNRTVRQALQHLAGKILDVEAHIDIKRLPVMKVDEVLLIQLFQNLISNALTYRSFERKLEISIGAEQGPGQWTFWVQDNGIGIDRAYWQKIFIIFQRLHSNAKVPGTGIGLAICKKIVERLNGRIWLDSVPGKGTTFFFTLPSSD